MTKKQFTVFFGTATRFIFTVLTAEAAVFLRAALLPPGDFASALFRANLPLCIDHLAAGIILYLLLAFCSAHILRST